MNSTKDWLDDLFDWMWREASSTRLHQRDIEKEARQRITDKLREARIDEAAEIHNLGFDILLKKGAASVVVGGTELDKLLNAIERKYGKDIILRVAGKHNRSKS